MKKDLIRLTVLCSVLISGAIAAVVTVSYDDRFKLKVPGGLAFGDFKGYDTWQAISMSHNGDKLALIVGNPAMIEAFKSGTPENGKPFPDGARMAKIHWVAKKNEAAPGQPLVAGALHDVDFMVKDSKQFAGSGGWGYAAFEYDPATDSFRAGNTADSPPQGNDAKCGAACHTAARSRDYVFTQFPKR